MINIIIGIIQTLDNGEVEINSTNLKKYDLYSLRKNNISVLLQNQICSDIIVEEYLVCQTGMSLKEIYNKISSTDLAMLFLMEDFDYRNYYKMIIDRLSGGEKQKIRLLQVLVKDADVIILDEPTSFLDIASITALIYYIRKYKYNKIIIIVSHDEIFDGIVDTIYSIGEAGESYDT